MIVEKLRELGVDIRVERVLELAGGGAIARPHIAEAMVEVGIVADEKEAFDRYISDDGLAYVPKHALQPADALRLIGGADGICVLAHPGMWRGQATVPDRSIEEMAEGGMVGPEVFHPDHDDEMRTKYAAIAERLGLDPHVVLGLPRGALRIPDGEERTIRDLRGAEAPRRPLSRPPRVRTGRP